MEYFAPEPPPGIPARDLRWLTEGLVRVGESVSDAKMRLRSLGLPERVRYGAAILQGSHRDVIIVAPPGSRTRALIPEGAPWWAAGMGYTLASHSLHGEFPIRGLDRPVGALRWGTAVHWLGGDRAPDAAWGVAGPTVGDLFGASVVALHKSAQLARGLGVAPGRPDAIEATFFEASGAGLLPGWLAAAEEALEAIAEPVG